MTAYDSIDGDYQDYVQAAARKTTAAPAGEPTSQAWADWFVAVVAERMRPLEEKYAELQADQTAVGRKHDALFRAVEALTKDPNLSQKARTRIRAVLVNHIEEWTQS